MKIAIISDTHDNLTALEKAVVWMNKNEVAEIIHCGDVCAPDTLQWLVKNFPGKIHLALGNVDADHFLSIKNPLVALHKEYGEVETDGKKIAFCHRPELARQLAQTGKYNLIFYGHTHQPWEETINSTRLINPGNLANLLYKASFATYDSSSGKLELKILEQL